MTSFSLTPMNVSAQQAQKHPDRVDDRSLLELDDFVKCAMLDPIMGFTTSKSFPNYKKIPEHVAKEVKKLLKLHMFSGSEHKVAETIFSILSLYYEDEHGRMKTIIENYLRLFDSKSGFTVAPCHTYTSEDNVGMKLIATKNWTKGEVLQLHNFSTTTEEFWPHLNEYSATESMTKNVTRVWLGPCAIANHSCDSNASLLNLATQKILIEVQKPIAIGEEIFVSYGADYFGLSCECDSCIRKRNLGQMDNTNSAPTSRRKRRSTNVNYSLQEAANGETVKAGKRRAYAIFKQIFFDVDYPEEVREETELKESEFAKSLDVLRTDELFEKLRDSNTIVDEVFSMVERAAVVAPNLEDYEQETLKELVKAHVKCGEILEDVCTVSMTSGSKRVRQRRNVIGNLTRLIESLTSVLQKQQEGVLKILKVEQSQNTHIEAKRLDQESTMREDDLAEGNCELLEKYKQAVQEHAAEVYGPRKIAEEEENPFAIAPMDFNMLPLSPPVGSKRNFPTSDGLHHTPPKTMRINNDTPQKLMTLSPPIMVNVKSTNPFNNITPLPNCPSAFEGTMNRVVREYVQPAISTRRFLNRESELAGTPTIHRRVAPIAIPIKHLNVTIVDPFGTDAQKVSATVKVYPNDCYADFDTALLTDGMNQEKKAEALGEGGRAMEAMMALFNEKFAEQLQDLCPEK